MKTVVAVVLGGLLVSSPAWSQTTTTPPAPIDRNAPAEKMAPGASASVGNSTGASMSSTDHMASKIIGSTIKNGANETIGDINDLMFDSNGNIKAVVAGIGGFLGLGEHRALLRFDQIQLNRDSNGRLFVLSQMTREQLKALPEWREPNEVVRSK